MATEVLAEAVPRGSRSGCLGLLARRGRLVHNGRDGSGQSGRVADDERASLVAKVTTGVRRTILALFVAGIVGAAIRLRGTGGRLRRKGPGWNEVHHSVDPAPDTPGDAPVSGPDQS